jgi:hypothetical protein
MNFEPKVNPDVVQNLSFDLSVWYGTQNPPIFHPAGLNE